MKRIIPVYIFQQVNVLLVSLYLLKFLCIGELTILEILYGAVFVLYGQGYRAEGKEGILTTQVTVKAYDEDKKPINFANLLDSLIY
ncbi:Tn5253 hypothetical protein [Streptococcus pneumoniae]|nr:Tn5253 hypothetical protein [Streptococcus pneumoniae]